MFHTFFIRRLFNIVAFAWAISAFGLPPQPELAQPRRELFSHAKHKDSLLKLGFGCVKCHDFSSKPMNPGPLASPIPYGAALAPRLICHECHLGKISLPHPSQCKICHIVTDAIKPLDHSLAWQTRHGKSAETDRDSCLQCHAPQFCNKCHSHQDSMNPVVHPANFRLFHSIQARADPQSCLSCHKPASFCMDCHSGRRAP